jgi:hypothetical protein
MRLYLLHTTLSVFFAVVFLLAHDAEAQAPPADSLSASTELRTIGAEGFLYEEGETWVYFTENERSMRRLIEAQNSGDPYLVEWLEQHGEVFRRPNGTAVRVVDVTDTYTIVEIPGFYIKGFDFWVLREQVRAQQ